MNVWTASTTPASLSAVDEAIRANGARKAELNARRAALRQALEEGDDLVKALEKDVDKSVETVKLKSIQEWAVFGAPGSIQAKSRISGKQLLADVCASTKFFVKHAVLIRDFILSYP